MKCPAEIDSRSLDALRIPLVCDLAGRPGSAGGAAGEAVAAALGVLGRGAGGWRGGGRHGRLGGGAGGGGGSGDEGGRLLRGSAVAAAVGPAGEDGGSGDDVALEVAVDLFWFFISVRIKEKNNLNMLCWLIASR